MRFPPRIRHAHIVLATTPPPSRLRFHKLPAHLVFCLSRQVTPRSRKPDGMPGPFTALLPPLKQEQGHRLTPGASHM